MKNKIIAAGTWGSVAFHFIVCGLPLVLAIFGSQLSFAGSISPRVMWGMMIFSGAMLALSAAFYFRGCGCEGKARRVQGIGLAIAGCLWAIALVGHFSMTGGAPCH